MRRKKVKDNYSVILIISIVGLILLASLLTLTSNIVGKAVSGPTDCGEDIDCFITASETCAPATAEKNITINFFGVMAIYTSTLKIIGEQESSCIFYSRIIDSSADLSPEIRQRLMEDNITEENITEMLLKVTESLKDGLGRESTCQYPRGQLTVLLNKWKEGKFSSNDNENASCIEGVRVSIIDNQFVPNKTSIFIGETVTWVNEEERVHSIVSDSFDNSPNLAPAESYQITAQEEGIVNYSSGTYPFIQGTFEVFRPVEGISYSLDTSGSGDLNMSFSFGVSFGSESDDSDREAEIGVKYDHCSYFNAHSVFVNESGYAIFCPNGTICMDAACVPVSTPIAVEDVRKLQTKLKTAVAINTSFYVITTLKDAEGTILTFNRELYGPLRKGKVISSYVNYHDSRKIKTKEIVIYDTPDPSKWTVYLNETFVVEYD